jgi:ATP-dependent DNA helicase RecQ
MSDRTLQEIARRIPRTTADLAHIDGIGEAKLNRYGEELVAEVNLFWETETAAGRTPRQFRAPAGRKRKKKSANQSVEVTWALLQEGLSVDEVVSQRGMARSTILGHMETLIIQGKEVDVTPLVSPSDRDELEKLFTVHGTASLGKVLEACNRAYTYDQARMVRALLRKRS